MLVKSDNSTVVSYVNHQGGTSSPQLCLPTQDLLTWCITNDITLSALHLAGKTNVMADALSRGRIIPMGPEWALHPSVVQAVFLRLGRPDVDLFISGLNKHLPVYCTRKPDHKAWATDALSIKWTNMFGYAFPPISFISRVLRKVEAELCKIILIAPFWPRQPWFQRIVNLLIHPPILLPLRVDLLSQPHSKILLPTPETLHLTCWLLSNDHSEQQAFRQTLHPWRPEAKESQHSRHTTAAYDIIIDGADIRLLVRPLHL